MNRLTHFSEDWSDVTNLAHDLLPIAKLYYMDGLRMREVGDEAALNRLLSDGYSIYIPVVYTYP